VNHPASAAVCDYVMSSETTPGSYADRWVSEFSSEDMPIHGEFLCVFACCRHCYEQISTYLECTASNGRVICE